MTFTDVRGTTWCPAAWKKPSRVFLQGSFSATPVVLEHCEVASGSRADDLRAVRQREHSNHHMWASTELEKACGRVHGQGDVDALVDVYTNVKLYVELNPTKWKEGETKQALRHHIYGTSLFTTSRSAMRNMIRHIQ